MPIAHRVQPFGETIFTEITRLAVKHQAVNLGQGFPNFDGPAFVKDAAIAAMSAGHNQYARMFGLPELNRAIAERFERDSGLKVDPESEVTVTSGCTEAIAAAFLGLVDPGDEVILFEPFYDSYPACVAFAGATVRAVTLRPPHFTFDDAELGRAFTSRTRAILVNSPNNPTGRVFSRKELKTIASLCVRHNVLAITDEVYEKIIFDAEHISLAALPGMRERTVTLSSLGKTFSLTGWKIGWAIAPPELTRGVRAAHQFITFATSTPFQHGAIAALRAPDSYYLELVRDYRDKRDLLAEGLSGVGFRVFVPAGTYFIYADHTPFGFADDVTFCRHLIEKIGVASIPPSAFYINKPEGRAFVRFAFCKDEGTLTEAIRRMQALRRAR